MTSLSDSHTEKIRLVAEHLGIALVRKEGTCKGGPFAAWFRADGGGPYNPLGSGDDSMELAAAFRTECTWQGATVEVTAYAPDGGRSTSIVPLNRHETRAAALREATLNAAVSSLPWEAAKTMTLPMCVNDIMGTGDKWYLFCIEFQVADRAMAQSAYLYARNHEEASARVSAIPLGIVDVRQLHAQHKSD